MNNGKLYLVPNIISENTEDEVIPSGVKEIILELNHFIVEDLRTARRYLRKLGYEGDFSEMRFDLVNKHSDPKQYTDYLMPALTGENIGLMSEAGVPCIADPGKDIVDLAQSMGIKPVPLVGPSSLLMALMASGLNGQNFAFVGYLPIENKDKLNRIKQLESRILTEDQTQIFIEAPYRNDKLFEFLTKNLNRNLKLCIATEISGKGEMIITKFVHEWKGAMPNIQKKNTVFLVGK